MKKYLIILPLVAIGLPVLMAVASRSAPDAREDESENLDLRSPADDLAPRAVVDATTYDFGTMDPLQTSTHVFVIRNEGAGPLELRTGSTTCKCTVSELAQPVIQPGHSGQVRLTWNTGRFKAIYAHGATILTNDPKRKSIDLRVRGLVRVQWGASPSDIVMESVEPDRPSSASTWIYSQVWDEMRVEDVSCSSARVRWEAEPAAPAKLAALKAKSACRLTVTLPAGMPEGFFNEILRCRLRNSEDEAAETFELSLSGKVLRRLALYGQGIESNGTLDLGTVPAGQVATRRVLIKVRDQAPDLAVQEIEVQPDFLDVQVVPYQTKTTAKGLYHLVVTVPDTAPIGVFRGAESGGRLKLVIDHPRIDDLELELRLAVTDGG